MKHKVCLLSLCLISVLMGTCLSACEGTTTTITTNEEHSLGDIVNNENDRASGDWFVGETVDEFGDSTGSTFCYTTCMGTFTNSATSGSDLAAGVYYVSSRQVFLFRLLEYNKTDATYLSSSDISIKCKVDEYVFDDTLLGEAPNGYLILPSNNNSYKKIYDYLIEGKEVRTVIYIDNSKYSFDISGNGFKDALSEQDDRKKQIGITGTYKNSVWSEEYGDWFTIKQESPTSGTITAASHSGSATVDYTYDPSTCVLSVTPTSDWTYRCVFDHFIVTDTVLLPDDGGTVEGIIPDKSTFDATIKWSSAKNKATDIYEFKADGTFIEYGTNYEGDDTETETGTYKLVDSIIIKNYSKGYVNVDYSFNGKLYSDVYMIDR